MQEAVLRECIVNLARIKEAIDAVAGGAGRGAGPRPGAAARARHHGGPADARASSAPSRSWSGSAARSARSCGPTASRSSPARLDRLADAIVAVEYYMETLQAGRADPWHDARQRRGAALADAASRRRQASCRSRPRAEAGCRHQCRRRAGQSRRRQSRRCAAAAAAASRSCRAGAEPAGSRRRGSPPARRDPEFLQLFVEEARENVARLAVAVPAVGAEPARRRRAARRAPRVPHAEGQRPHGRRAARRRVLVEHRDLLNRVISQTLARSPESWPSCATRSRPCRSWSTRLEHGGDTGSIDVAGIMARADALSGAKAPCRAAGAGSAAPSRVALPRAGRGRRAPAEVARGTGRRRVEPAGMDPVLRDIFRKETAGHIAGRARSSSSAARAASRRTRSREALYRACHTLSGIAKTAGARQGIKVAEPMEHYVRKLYDNGHGLPRRRRSRCCATRCGCSRPCPSTSTRTPASSPSRAG